MSPLRLLVLLSVVATACSGGQPNPGFKHLSEGRAEDAEAAFRRGLADRPGDRRLLDGLGAALAQQGEPMKGCGLLTEKSKPLTTSECWLEAATKAMEDRRPVRVLMYREKAAPQEWPKSAQAQWYALAEEAATAQKRWDVLLEIYPKWLSLSPADATLHYRYARVLEMRQRNDEAVREYELAQSLDPDNSEIERYVRKLEHVMSASGESGAARVERFDSTSEGAGKASTAPSAFTSQKWEKGSMTATIQIESMDRENKESDATIPVTVRKAHWPSEVAEKDVLPRLERMAGDLDCETANESGKVGVTFGAQGTVSKLAFTSGLQKSRRCLRKVLREWFLGDLKGGYLQVVFPYPAPDTATEERSATAAQ